MHELANKGRISVTGASKLLANILYSYPGMGLSVGTMIAGWDETVKTYDSCHVFTSSFNQTLVICIFYMVVGFYFLMLNRLKRCIMT